MTQTDDDSPGARVQRHAIIEFVNHWDKLYCEMAKEFGHYEQFARLSASVRELRRCL